MDGIASPIDELPPQPNLENSPQRSEGALGRERVLTGNEEDDLPPPGPFPSLCFQVLPLSLPIMSAMAPPPSSSRPSASTPLPTGTGSPPHPQPPPRCAAPPGHLHCKTSRATQHRSRAAAAPWLHQSPPHLATQPARPIQNYHHAMATALAGSDLKVARSPTPNMLTCRLHLRRRWFVSGFTPSCSCRGGLRRALWPRRSQDLMLGVWVGDKP